MTTMEDGHDKLVRIEVYGYHDTTGTLDGVETHLVRNVTLPAPRVPQEPSAWEAEDLGFSWTLEDQEEFADRRFDGYLHVLRQQSNAKRDTWKYIKLLQLSTIMISKLPRGIQYS